MLDGNVIETMRVMVQAEKMVGLFYKECSEVFRHDAGFWNQLAQEEYHHAEVIGNLLTQIAASPQDFEPGKMSPVDALATFIARVTSYRASLRNGTLTETNALLAAYLIETTFAEHKYTEAVRTTNAIYLEQLKQLTVEEANHKAIISRKMKAGRAAA